MKLFYSHFKVLFAILKGRPQLSICLPLSFLVCLKYTVFIQETWATVAQVLEQVGHVVGLVYYIILSIYHWTVETKRSEKFILFFGT